MKTSLTITILDDNDNAPVFSEAAYRFDIPENILPGTEIGMVRATDPDEGANGVITYRVENDHMASIFLISAVSFLQPEPLNLSKKYPEILR